MNKGKGLGIIVAIAFLFLTGWMLLPGAVLADDDDDDDECDSLKSDFALFDGTNPANRDTQDKTGVVCGVTNKKQTCTGPGSLDTSCRYEIRETSSRSTRSVGS